MSGAPFYNINTNPNAKGGAFNYDSRTGLGYGQTTNGGLGSNWNMGDALSSPKGQWDYEEELKITANTTVLELALFAGLIDDEKYNKLTAGIESKAHLSFHRGPVDSLAHKGTDISSFGGLGNSIAGVIGLSAGHNIEGNIVSESSLEQYIKEVILCELTASGRISVMSSSGNDPYPIDVSSASTNTANPGSNRNANAVLHAIDQDGIGQNTIKVIFKGYESDIEYEMTPTTDGAETVKSKSSEIGINNNKISKNKNMSSGEFLNKTTSRDFLDKFNVLSKNQKVNIYK